MFMGNTENKDFLLGRIRGKLPLSLGQQVRLTLLLCGPAILAVHLRHGGFAGFFRPGRAPDRFQ